LVRTSTGLIFGSDINVSTPDQIDAMRHRIQAAHRVCLDRTGCGDGCADYLIKEFQEYKPDEHKFGKIELCNFSNDLKCSLFTKLRMAFDTLKLRVPVNREVREDLHSVSRATTPNGNVTYRAPRNADGHADRCTALALCLRASQTCVSMMRPIVFDTPLTRMILQRRREIEANRKFWEENGPCV